MGGLLYAGFRSVDIHLYFLASYSVSTLVYGYANINSSPDPPSPLPLPPHTVFLFLCANIKNNNSRIMFFSLNIMGALFCWECWPSSCFGKTDCIMDCIIQRICMALAFFCRCKDSRLYWCLWIVSKWITLLDQSADVQCSLTSSFHITWCQLM